MPRRAASLFLASVLTLSCTSPASAPFVASPTPAPLVLPAGRILFSQAGIDLWSSDPDGSRRTRLTTDGAKGGYVGGRWSPDGSLIAAERAIPGESGTSLYLVRADGSSIRLTDPDTFLDGYDWSRDGRYLAWGELTSTLPTATSAGGTGSVFVHDAQRGVTLRAGSGTHPSFSPDSVTVGYAHESGAIAVATVAEMCTRGQACAGASPLRTLVTLADLSRISAAVAPRGMGLLGGPVWTNDGRKVAYAAIEKGPVLEALQVVYIQEAKPGAPREQWAIGKTGAVHHVAELRWSPAADTLAYAIINAQPHHHWIGTITPGDSALHPLYDSTKHFIDFAWAPDGSVILLQIDDDDAWGYLRPGSEGLALLRTPGGWRPDWCRCSRGS